MYKIEAHPGSSCIQAGWRDLLSPSPLFIATLKQVFRQVLGNPSPLLINMTK